MEVAGLLKEPTSKFSCRSLPTSHHFLNHSDMHEGPQEESRRPGKDKAMNKAMKLAHAKMMKDPKKSHPDMHEGPQEESCRPGNDKAMNKAMKLAHAKMMKDPKKRAADRINDRKRKYAYTSNRLLPSSILTHPIISSITIVVRSRRRVGWHKKGSVISLLRWSRRSSLVMMF